MHHSLLRRLYLGFLLLFLIVAPILAQEQTQEPLIPTETLPPSPTLEPTLTPLPTASPTELPTATLWPSETLTATASATATETETATQAEVTPELTAEVTAALTDALGIETATETATLDVTNNNLTNTPDPSASTPFTSMVHFDITAYLSSRWGDESWQLVEMAGEEWIAPATSGIIETWQGSGKNIALETHFVLPNGSFSLSLRNSPSGNYLFSIDSTGNLSLWRNNVLLSNNLALPLGNLSHRLKFRANEQQVTVELDGNLLLSFNDNFPLPAGTIQLSLQDAQGFLLREVDVTMAQSEYDLMLESLPSTISIPLANNSSAGRQLAQTSGTIQSENPSNSILFTQTTEGNDLYLLDLDLCANNTGTACEPQRLSNMPAGGTFYSYFYSPRWSPERDKIAFIYEGPETNGAFWLYVMPLPTNPISGMGTAQLLTDYQVDTTVSWSPNGDYILFSAYPERDIYLINANCSNCVAQNLSNTPDYLEWYPTWSPDSTKIAYVRDLISSEVNEASELFVMDADGSNPTSILDTNTNDEYWPDWSPDGTKIAYGSRTILGGGIYQVLLVNTSGSPTPSMISGGGRIARNPTWSPDGQHLIYVYKPQNSANNVLYRLAIADLANTENNCRYLLPPDALEDNEVDWGYLADSSTTNLPANLETCMLKGLYASYYAVASDPSSYISRTNSFDPLIDFSQSQVWDLDSSYIDGFAVQWTGLIVPQNAQVPNGSSSNFILSFGDAPMGTNHIRVWWNGQLVISTWYTILNGGIPTATIPNVVAGQAYELWIEYMHFSPPQTGVWPILEMRYSYGNKNNVIVPSLFLEVRKPSEMSIRPSEANFGLNYCPVPTRTPTPNSGIQSIPRGGSGGVNIQSSNDPICGQVPTRIPTVTVAPTLIWTVGPTLTPAPSMTPIPLPTDTPIPLPTDTPIPTPTDTPTATVTPMVANTLTPDISCVSILFRGVNIREEYYPTSNILTTVGTEDDPKRVRLIGYVDVPDIGRYYRVDGVYLTNGDYGNPANIDTSVVGWLSEYVKIDSEGNGLPLCDISISYNRADGLLQIINFPVPPLASFATATTTPNPPPPTPTPTLPPDYSGQFPLPMTAESPVRISRCGLHYEEDLVMGIDLVPVGGQGQSYRLIAPAYAEIVALDRDGTMDDTSNGGLGNFVAIRVPMINPNDGTLNVPQVIRDRLNGNTLDGIDYNVAPFPELVSTPERYENIDNVDQGALYIGYGHLANFAPQLVDLDPDGLDSNSENDLPYPITVGTFLGMSGSTGFADGEHLHATVFYSPEIHMLDPEAMEVAMPRSSYDWYFWAFDLGFSNLYGRTTWYGASRLVNPLVLWPSAQRDTHCPYWQIIQSVEG